MDVFTIAVTAAVTSLVSGLVGAVVATLIGMAKDKRRNDTASDKAMRDGMTALMWRELKNIHRDAVSNGGLTIEERTHLDTVYSVYHDGLHANGTGTRLYMEAIESPVID